MPIQNRNNNLRLKLKATIEANIIARNKMNFAYDKIKELRNEIKQTNGPRKQYLQLLTEILEEKMNNKEEAIANMEYGEIGDGGHGWGFGGGCGADSAGH